MNFTTLKDIKARNTLEKAKNMDFAEALKIYNGPRKLDTKTAIDEI